MEKGDYDLERAVISGASHALKYKEKHPRATEQEVLKYITDRIEEIIENMEVEE